MSRQRRTLVAPAVALALLLPAACTLDEQAVTSEVEEAPEPGSPPGEDAEGAEERIERWIFDRVNDERRERGLEPLEWDDQMAEDAREWSRQMADEGELEHEDLEGVLEGLEGHTSVGENIFRATGPTPGGQVHVGWMRSEGHRVNVLDPHFDRLGVGVVCLEGGATWATQRFGSTEQDVPDPDREVPAEEPIVADDDAGPSCPG